MLQRSYHQPSISARVFAFRAAFVAGDASGVGGVELRFGRGMVVLFVDVCLKLKMNLRLLNRSQSRKFLKLIWGVAR